MEHIERAERVVGRDTLSVESVAGKKDMPIAFVLMRVSVWDLRHGWQRQTISKGWKSDRNTSWRISGGRSARLRASSDTGGEAVLSSAISVVSIVKETKGAKKEW